MQIEAAKEVRELNDRLRTTLNVVFGDVTLSPAIQRLPAARQAEILLAVMEYEFPRMHDHPWFADMHERGVVKVKGEYCYWGIRYRDRDTGAPRNDPTTPGIRRQLHILCRADVEQAA